jgi:hypothetical protein
MVHKHEMTGIDKVNILKFEAHLCSVVAFNVRYLSHAQVCLFTKQAPSAAPSISLTLLAQLLIITI